MKMLAAGVALVALMSTGAIAQSSGGSTVTIELANIRAGTGDLYVSLQKRHEFMKPTGSHGEIVAKPAPGARVVTLTGVAAGDYAANIWHDLNGNKRWDSDERGMPLDGWTSVNAETIRAKPEFDQVRFTVADAPVTLKLVMRYGA